MMRAGTFGIRVVTVSFLTIAFFTACSIRAETTDDPKFAALQAEATNSFKQVVTPFIDNYCTRCHGQDRQRGGINFSPALKKPGESASTQRWKQALAVVKSHDMPPEDATKQPSDEDRAKFLEGIRKIKFLCAKDPGTFVIRRLTKMEYGNTLHDLLGSIRRSRLICRTRWWAKVI